MLSLYLVAIDTVEEKFKFELLYGICILDR